MTILINGRTLRSIRDEFERQEDAGLNCDIELAMCDELESLHNGLNLARVDLMLERSRKECVPIAPYHPRYDPADSGHATRWLLIALLAIGLTAVALSFFK